MPTLPLPFPSPPEPPQDPSQVDKNVEALLGSASPTRNFNTNYDRLQREYTAKWSKPWTTTGSDTWQHRKFDPLGAKDARSRDKSQEEINWILGRARELGIKIKDFSKHIPNTGTGFHLHMQPGSEVDARVAEILNESNEPAGDQANATTHTSVTSQPAAPASSVTRSLAPTRPRPRFPATVSNPSKPLASLQASTPSKAQALAAWINQGMPSAGEEELARKAPRRSVTARVPRHERPLLQEDTLPTPLTAVGKGVDVATRPLQYLSTLTAGVQRGVGADIASWVDLGAGKAASEYGPMNILEAAADRFWTGETKPGYEQPVGELYKLGVEALGGEPESTTHKVIKNTLEGVTDPTNYMAAGELGKTLGFIPEAPPPVTIAPKANFPWREGSIIPNEPPPMPLRTGGLPTLAGERMAAQAARRVESAPPVPEGVRPSLERVRRAAAEPPMPTRRQQASEIGLTPEGSGSTVLSNEELARNEVFYTVTRDGRLKTYQGKQPDNPGLGRGESIIGVNQRTGAIREAGGESGVLSQHEAKLRGALEKEGFIKPQGQTPAANVLPPPTQSTGPRQTVPEPPTPTKHVPGERSFPKTLEASSLPKGSDLSYDVLSHEETMAAAEARLAKGTDSAMEFVRSTEEPSAEHTATAIYTIRNLVKEGRVDEAADLAGHISERLTRTGQAADAARIAQELSPEQVLLQAQKTAQRTGRPLSKNMASTLADNATKAKSLQAELDTVNQKLGNTPLIDRLSTMANDARLRLKEAGVKFKAQEGERGAISLGGNVPGNPQDYVTVGAEHLARKGYNDIALWQSEMIREFGEAIRSHLPDIYKESYAFLKRERANMREASGLRGITKANPGITQDQARQLLAQRDMLRSQIARARNEMASVFTRLERGNPYVRAIFDTLALPRTIMSSADISYTARQGMATWMMEPSVGKEMMARQLESFKSQAGFENVVNHLESHPMRQLAEQSGLDILTLKQRRNPFGLDVREEFFPSKLAEHLPLIARSERAFTAAGDVTRMELFDKWAHQLMQEGKYSPRTHPEQFKKLAEFVNIVSGRAPLGRLEPLAPWLNQVLFSPKLLMSRIQLMNPVYLAKLPPGVRGLAMKKVGRLYATMGGTLAALDAIPGVDVGWNPASADFAKVKVGNTRIDITGGQGIMLRTFARSANAMIKLMSGDSKVAAKGKEELTRIFDPREPWGFARGKLSPVASLANDAIFSLNRKGEHVNYQGKPFHWFGEEDEAGNVGSRWTKGGIPERFMPMGAQDMIEAFREGGVGAAAGTGVGSALGFGMQTYKDKGKP